MLFGPLSETISSVSCRACALAGEKIAGAASADGRGGRGFQKITTLHWTLPDQPWMVLESSAKGVPVASGTR